jgi:hypothetical protein
MLTPEEIDAFFNSRRYIEGTDVEIGVYRPKEQQQINFVLAPAYCLIPDGFECGDGKAPFFGAINYYIRESDNIADIPPEVWTDRTCEIEYVRGSERRARQLAMMIRDKARDKSCYWTPDGILVYLKNKHWHKFGELPYARQNNK